ncbi:galactose-specific lectin nattectin-like [Salmo salar]|uniref:Galactose-specific lectin nattectin-like n=1 Tax=Salmo salar TaxID=8030 RepID=A0A1S3P5U8_SALSA|nr:galactose-specific lectin nattectin-like [Salmo salar]|eukprot:XP_014022967.1 PREDICTED: galactose-specific lectin nattectin-like [Salmo salar]
MLVFLCIVSLLSLTLDAEQDFTMPDQEEELSQKSCDMGWYSFSGRCYKYVASQLDWADAESYCVAQGGNLASVHSENEHKFIQKLVKSQDPAERYTWIGLYDTDKEGRWMWSDGSKMDLIMKTVKTNFDQLKLWNDYMGSIPCLS